MVGDIRMWLYRAHPGNPRQCAGADHSHLTLDTAPRRAAAPSCLAFDQSYALHELETQSRLRC
jgi:hypothetical protein